MLIEHLVIDKTALLASYNLLSTLLHQSKIIGWDKNICASINILYWAATFSWYFDFWCRWIGDKTFPDCKLQERLSFNGFKQLLMHTGTEDLLNQILTSGENLSFKNWRKLILLISDDCPFVQQSLDALRAAGQSLMKDLVQQS